MNKELEEAIKRLDKFKSIKILYGNTFAITLQEKMHRKTFYNIE